MYLKLNLMYYECNSGVQLGMILFNSRMNKISLIRLGDIMCPLLQCIILYYCTLQALTWYLPSEKKSQ